MARLMLAKDRLHDTAIQRLRPPYDVTMGRGIQRLYETKNSDVGTSPYK